MKSQLPFILLNCLSLLGCASSSNFSTTKLGNQVLEFASVLPSPRAFKASDALGDSAVKITPEQEYYLGRAVAARIISLYPLSQDQKLTSYLNLIGQSVLASTDYPESFGGYHFAVLDSQEFNALSAPSGFIFVTSAMIEKMPDEDALASVLAHEIAHVQLRHGLKSISKERMDSIIKDLGRLATSLQCNELLQGTTGIFSGVVGDLVDNLVKKGYSREQELEADATAIKFLQSARYNAFSIVDMLSILEHQDRQVSKGGWFSTHPSAADRKDSAESELVGFRDNSSPTGRTARTKRFEEVVRG